MPCTETLMCVQIIRVLSPLSPVAQEQLPVQGLVASGDFNWIDELLGLDQLLVAHLQGPGRGRRRGSAQLQSPVLLDPLRLTS